MGAPLDESLVIVLAGGAGERLHPLTKERAKPAVHFGGPYRIIDFVLSNCINSGLRRIYIATQYKSLSLHRHVVARGLARGDIVHDLDDVLSFLLLRLFLLLVVLVLGRETDRPRQTDGRPDRDEPAPLSHNGNSPE